MKRKFNTYNPHIRQFLETMDDFFHTLDVLPSPETLEVQCKNCAGTITMDQDLVQHAKEGMKVVHQCNSCGYTSLL